MLKWMEEKYVKESKGNRAEQIEKSQQLCTTREEERREDEQRDEGSQPSRLQ